MAETIAMILAGGQGSRLSILSEHRAKPAVPFGSNFRIIDFALSNTMHSHIRYVGVMTQYKPYSLMAHIGNGEAWGFGGRTSMAKILPPYMGSAAGDWYAGTADAIYQNISFIERFNVDTVLVLSGDHIYRMAYGEMIDSHVRRNADLTIATQAVPHDEAHRFGILKADRRGRVELFQEKPRKPQSNQANLGIYVFKRSVLEDRLNADAEDPNSSHDFGKDILPRMVEECDCYTYEFPRYWRDVGTLQSYWEANMECLTPRLGLDLRKWGVHTNWHEIPLEYQMPCHVYGGGQIVNSIVGKGSSIRGSVVNSVLFRGVEVGPGAEIHDSIIMDGAKIGAGAKVRHLIADKHSVIGPNTIIGDGDNAPLNKETPEHLSSGLTLMGMYSKVPEDYQIGRNVLIYPDLEPEHFPADKLEHGETLHNKKCGMKFRQ